MRINSVRAVPLSASFRVPFRFGQTTRTTSPNVVVAIGTSDGHVGWGEACPVPAFTAETQRSVVALLEDHVASRLVGRDPLDRMPLLAGLAPVLADAPFTMAAVDTALIDLAGRALGIPASRLLGGAFRDSVEVHGSVGWDEDAGRMVETALAQRNSYRWLKLYAGRGELDDDLARLRAVRDAVGPTSRLMVDINGQWSPSDLDRALPALADMDITVLEQPLPVAVDAPLPPSTLALGTSIIADESVRTLTDAARVAAGGSVHVLNIGHSKVGGPTTALAMARVAAAFGVGVMVGSVLEMGIGTAMGVPLAAALPSLAYPSYLVGPLKYREQITMEQITVADGCVAVPDGPGLGVTIDEREIARLDARNAS